MKSAPKMPAYYLTVDDAFAGQRIDNFLMTKLKNVPKTRVYRILRKGEVRVNKKRAAPSYRLEAGDSIRIPPLTPETEKKLTAPPKDLQDLLTDRVIYEDKNLFIINKPAGIAVHGGSASPWGVVEVLRYMHPEFSQLELAHRLDLDTSGCLILAKKRSTLKELHDLLRSGEMRKEYWALTKGHWITTELYVEAPLRKNILSSGERIVKVHVEGKASTTHFDIVQAYPKATLVNARLLTGRTHQIRVHAQYRKHPIAGDEKYGDKEFNKSLRELGLKRLFLHAHSVKFKLPSSQEEIHATAPLEKELAIVLKHLV